MNYILLIILCCAWCTIHSGMISLAITDYLKEKLGNKSRFYRLFFNFVALITLIPVLHYGDDFRGQVVFRWDGFLLVFQLIMVSTALFLFISGSLKYDMLQFLGIRQIKLENSRSTLSLNENIETSGILSLTRHPWYLATIIFIWVSCKDVYVSTLIVNVIFTFYIVIGTVLEERKLITEYRDNYRDYKKQVSRLSQNSNQFYNCDKNLYYKASFH
jgi:protein-S-isoprenylcysteine O-methyltransferase Ste14